MQLLSSPACCSLLRNAQVARTDFVVRELIEFIRSTPLVLQIFFVFYVGPQFGIFLSPWTSGIIARWVLCRQVATIR
ncbi:hypothetical protein AJ88_37130 [Mesorhizobium amorphae CCBAU 01583]|nr:hypothetical protein AJ88_37130 [Mesorhizobium amorphae CCBAU 01583]